MGNIGSVFWPSELHVESERNLRHHGLLDGKRRYAGQNDVPLPPPTNYPPTTATSGLSEYASTRATPFSTVNRPSLTTNSGTSWLDSNAQYPVKYSFNIASFSTKCGTYGAEAWLFLSPSPERDLITLPIGNETNMVIAFIQDNTNGRHPEFTIQGQRKIINRPCITAGSETRIVAGVTNHYYYSRCSWKPACGAIVVSIGPNEYNVTNESGNLTMSFTPKAPRNLDHRIDSPTDGKLIAPRLI